jgi:penicillin-binding protein 1B
VNKGSSSWKNIFHKEGTSGVTKGFRVTSAVVWNLVLVLFVIGLIGAAFAGGAGAGYFASLVQDEPIRDYEELHTEIYDFEEASEVYFANDEYLGDLVAPLERREVSLDEVSDNLINAIIATEDEYFFEHEGIVPKALMRAVMQDFSNAATQTGGSTLTQQLVKNQVLSSEVTHDRKAVEILLAMRVERFMDKEDILEAYLNVVPFGRNASGVQIAGARAAAEGIFDTDVSELNIPQSAFIAGLPQSPFAYTPFTNNAEQKESIEAGTNRMGTVLSRMKDSGYIDEEEYEEALNYDIREDFAEPQPSSLDEYPYIVDAAREKAHGIIMNHLMDEDDVVLEEIDDEDYRALVRSRYNEAAEEELQQGGFEIHTTIHKDIYDAQQEAVEDFEHFAPNETAMIEVGEEGEEEEVEMEFMEQTGAVMIDNRTGGIISFVGGRDYEESNFNRATGNMRRHTGSTMKSLLTYAVGFETGSLQPGYITADIPYDYEADEFDEDPANEVSNFDNDHSGLITVREALSRSRNVPAVREMSFIEHDAARQALIDYGFEPYMGGDEGIPYQSTALGTLGMNVEANTSAFSTFGNDGKRKESYMVERIVDSNGDTIFEQNTEEEIDILSEETNYLMIDVMRDVMESGLGTAPQLPGFLDFESDLAGKTGTSNETRDAWFVGLNPNVTMGIWVGYDTEQIPVPQEHDGISYGPRTQMLWAELANAAYDVNDTLMAPEEEFQQPDGVVEEEVCGVSGLAPTELCEDAGLVTTDLFNEEFAPSEAGDDDTIDYVQIDGDNYLALDSTPSEFTRSGVAMLDERFDFSSDDLSEYLPSDWDDLASASEEAPDNGRTPSTMPDIDSGSSSISWDAHPDEEVIGYRVYHASSEGGSFSEVESVRWDEDFSYSGSSGAYRVTAVDVAGRESSPSNSVTVGSGSNDSSDDDESDDNTGSNDEDTTDNTSNNDDENDNSAATDDESNDNNSDNNNGSNDNAENNNQENNAGADNTPADTGSNNDSSTTTTPAMKPAATMPGATITTTPAMKPAATMPGAAITTTPAMKPAVTMPGGNNNNSGNEAGSNNAGGNNNNSGNEAGSNNNAGGSNNNNSGNEAGSNNAGGSNNNNSGNEAGGSNNTGGQ